MSHNASIDNNSEDSLSSISWGGLLGATLTVLVTTLDDSIWLVSFVGTSSVSASARLVNAATFLGSLMGLAILCCALAIAIEQGLATKTSFQAHELELALEWIAVLVCWALAVGFYIKKQLKRRRRRQQQQQQQQENEQLVQNLNHDTEGYGSLPSSQPEEAADTTTTTTTTIRHAQPCTIMSLTTLGFLDEISYFPALMVGDIFTGWELILGTLLAGICMLGIQAFLASQCKPWIDWLDDHIQLHGVIAVFAILLTINLILDYATPMD